MSYMKRYLEEICTTITDAYKKENSDPYQYVPFRYKGIGDTEEAVMTALCDGAYDTIFSQLDGCWTECHAGSNLAEKPITFKAMSMLLPLVSDEILSDSYYTRSPLSLIGCPSISLAIAVYTGGGIYIYYGKIADQLYFLADDESDETILLDADPAEDLDEAEMPNWQKAHTVGQVDDLKASILAYIIENQPKGNYLISDMETKLNELKGENS